MIVVLTGGVLAHGTLELQKRAHPKEPTNGLLVKGQVGAAGARRIVEGWSQ
jgi:hypothetical protein